MNRALIGGIAAVVLAVGVIAGIAAGGMLGGSSPSPTAVAVVPSASAPPSTAPAESSGPDASPAVTPAPPSPSASPSPTPVPTPVLVPAPLTGRPVKPAIAARHVIAVMIDDQADARPQSGLSRASVVWQAPAEGGIPRYMALFQEAIRRASGRSAARACTSSRGRRSGGRCTCMPAARRRPWRSSRRRRVGAPTVYNGDALRSSGDRYLWRIEKRFAPHNVYTDGKHLRRLAKRLGAKPVAGPDAGLAVRRGRRRSRHGRRAASSSSPISRTGSSTATTASTTLPRARLRRGQAGRRGHQGSASRPRTSSSWRCASRRSTTARTSAGSRPRWSAPGPPGSPPTATPSRAPGRRARSSRPTRFFGPDGKPVTLTIGQTFVQVVPRGTRLTIRDGKAPAPTAVAFPGRFLV